MMRPCEYCTVLFFEAKLFNWQAWTMLDRRVERVHQPRPPEADVFALVRAARHRQTQIALRDVAYWECPPGLLGRLGC
jgi:hypothetical protein